MTHRPCVARTFTEGAALPFLVALGLTAPFCFRAISETDAGWHLALGRLIAGGTFPRTNLLSWTAPEHPFYPTSWAYDLTSYAAVQVGGPLGLQLFTLLTLALALLATVLACPPKGGARWYVPALALLLVDRITPRPHMVSWALLAAVLALHLPRTSLARRLGAVVLIALGSNFHAGAIFSSAVVIAFAAQAALETRRWGREAGIAALSVVALGANPGGPYNTWYAFRHLSMYETLPLTEFETPSWSSFPGFYVAAALLVVTLVTQRPWRLVPHGLLASFTGVGLFAARVAYKSVLLFAPTFAQGHAERLRRHGPRVGYGLVVLLFLVSLGSSFERLLTLRVGGEFDAAEMPVRAVSFIRQTGLSGKMWNGFTDGGYLSWALPEVPVFQDARVLAYDPAFFQRQLRAEAESPEAFDRLLREAGVEWALTTNVPGGLTGNGRLGPPGWALVYWDEVNELYIRRDAARWASVVERYEYRLFLPGMELEPLLGSLAEAPAEYAKMLDAELARFDSTTPGLLEVALLRCGAQVRMRGLEKEALCGRASAQVQGEVGRTLLERAKNLAPAAKH